MYELTFLSDIEVKRRPGQKGEWELTADLIYVGNRDQFLVPKGFKTDFASIPGFLTSFIPSHGRFDAAAIVHDYLYREKPFIRVSLGYYRIQRKDADGIFRRIMKELGVGLFRRNIMYRAVRLGGAIPWARNER